MKKSSPRTMSSCAKLLTSLSGLAFVVSFTACGALVNKQNNSPTTKAPNESAVPLPPDMDDPIPDPSSTPAPTPAPTPAASPIPGQKPCHRFFEQDGQTYEQLDDGEMVVVDVPVFTSEDEAQDWWRKKGGDCDKHPNPPANPTPAPTPVAKPTPTPPPASPVHPSYYCRPDANGNFAFTTTMTSGTGNDPDGGSYLFAQGGLCIERPLKEVWAVTLNQPLMIWVGVAGTGYPMAAPAGVTKAFDVHYTVTRRYLGVPFTVTWEMNWFHTIQKGTTADPEQILINYHRYHGTTHIPYWEGSIILQKVTDKITGVFVRNQIRADSIDMSGAISAANDMIVKMQSGTPDDSELP